jgi:hypothetical protein
MNRRILWGLSLTLALSLVRIPTFAQAVAESVLLGAGSSTATVKAGSALNSALNQGSKQLAGSVQRQVLRPVAPGKKLYLGAGKVSTSTVKSTTTPAQGAVIASIQGAVISCAPTSPTVSTAGSNSATKLSQKNCSGQPASVPAPQKYNSVITLSFPK